MLDRLLEAAAPLLSPWWSVWGSEVTGAETIGMVLALVMVVANMRVHPMAWPLAIISSGLYALLFAQFKLYGEACLQVLFMALAGWGWWQWLRGTQSDGQALTVGRLSTRQRRWALAGTLLAWPLLACLLAKITDSDVPWWDALPTVASITGQVLLGRKLIENWPTWVAVNLVSMALFAQKGLWLTVVLYAVFTLMALQGWRAWYQLEGQTRA